MEQYKASLERRGKTLTTDGKSRMSQPPLRGRGLDDWGTSDFQSQGRGGSSSSRPTKPFHPVSFSEDSFLRDDSFDELDLLRSQSRRGPQESKAPSSKLSNTSKDQSADRVAFLVDGQYYEPHPDYRKDGKKILEGMKFKKNKKEDVRSAAPSTDTASSAYSKADATKLPSRCSTQPKVSSFRGDPLRRPFQPPTRIANKGDLLDRKKAPTAKKKLSHLEEDQDKTPKPSKVQSKPQPAKDELLISLSSDDDDETLTTSWGITKEEERKHKGKAKAMAWPMDDMSPVKGSSAKQECPLDQISPLKETSNRRSIVRSFPLDKRSPSRDENDAIHRKDKKKHTSLFSSEALHSLERPSSSTHSFPDISPLSSPVKPPNSSTQGSQQSSSGSQGRKTRKQTASAKGPRRRVIESSEESQSEAESVRSLTKVRPFPMGTQVLESIRSPSAKRASPDAEDHSPFLERREKKRARGADEILRELMHSDGVDEDDEDDLLFNDPNLDPARLCPWCDELLPPTPSPHLEHLVSVARARSSRDPRPTNPLGLYAAPTVFINVCQRHRFESHQLPLAKQRGWPTQIAWDKLAGRVRGLKRYLQKIVGDIDEDFLPGRERQHDDGDATVDAEDDESALEERPRKGSTFWKEVVRSVRQKGARKAAGVRGQMTTFSKTQPGYYGELGSVVISQTIYDLFPPADFLPNSTSPLTPAEFIQRVLVPEAALRLVMDDMCQTRQEAVKTLRDSAQYGVAMFPDEHTEGFSASEEIVKARAAARRKQLQKEDEEEEDAEMWNAFPEEDFGDVGPGKLSRTSSHVSIESSRPRRACAVRAQSIIDSDSDSDVSMASSRASTASIHKKPIAKAGKSKTNSTKGRTERGLDDWRSQSVEIVSEPDAPPKHAPRPRAISRTPDPGQDDTDVNPRTSDAEPDFSDAPPASQQIQWGADGKAKRRTKDDNGWQMVDFQTTPKAKKVSRAPSGLSSTFAQQITKTRNSSSAREGDGWTFSLRSSTSSDHAP